MAGTVTQGSHHHPDVRTSLMLIHELDGLDGVYRNQGFELGRQEGPLHRDRAARDSLGPRQPGESVRYVTAELEVLLLHGGECIRRGLCDSPAQLRLQFQQRRSVNQREQPGRLVPAKFRDMTFDVGQRRDQAARVPLSHSWAPPAWFVLR